MHHQGDHWPGCPATRRQPTLWAFILLYPPKFTATSPQAVFCQPSGSSCRAWLYLTHSLFEKIQLMYIHRLPMLVYRVCKQFPNSSSLLLNVVFRHFVAFDVTTWEICWCQKCKNSTVMIIVLLWARTFLYRPTISFRGLNFQRTDPFLHKLQAALSWNSFHWITTQDFL